MSWQDDPVVNAPASTGASWQNDPIVQEPSTLESLGHAAVNNLPFGGQLAAGAQSLPVVGTGKDYSTNLEDWNKQTELDKATHPYAYGTGAVAGALAPLAIPGVGEALEAAPITGNAALGALSAAGNTDLMKNPGEALKEAAIGGGIGGATAGIIGKIFPKSAPFEEMANSKAVQNADLTPAYLKNLSREEYEKLGPYIRENNLVGIDKEKLLEKALARQKEVGQSIGKVGDELTKAGVTATDDDILQAVGRLQSEAEKTASLQNPELRKMAIWHNKGANDIFNKISEDPSWQSIQNLKQAYGKAAFKSTGEIRNEAAKNTYFVLRDMLNNLTKRAEVNPNLPNTYKQALADYHTLDPIVEGLSHLVGRERAGISASIPKTGGFLHRLVATFPGQENPMINLPTAALASTISPHFGPLLAIPTLTNPALQSKFASGMAKGIEALPPNSPQVVNQMIHDYLINLYQKKDE